AQRTAMLVHAVQLAPSRSSGASVDAISLPSFPLGLSEEKDFPMREITLDAGDRLVFLTDGFVEAADASGEPFGFERMEALLRAEAGSGAARLRDVILAALAAHTGPGAAGDDRTLVILTIH